MRWAWRLGACFGGACLAVGGVGTAPLRAATTTDTELAGYFALAAASGFQVTQDQPAALVHPQAEFEAGDAVTTLSTGPRGYAFSTVAWPGPLIGNAGTTLIVGGGAPSSVNVLDDPVRAEARTGSGEPKVENNSVPGATMTAAASGGDVSAITTMAGATVPAAVVIGKVTTASVTKLEGNTVTGTASTALSNIEIAGGLVKIASFTSVASATADGVKDKGTAKGETVVTGATVAGVPVSIDQSGVHAGDAGTGATSVANAAVNDALSAAGMRVFLAGLQTKVTGAQASEQAGSVVFVWKPPADPSSESFSVTLAGANVSVQASGGSGAADLSVPLPEAPGGVDTPATPATASNPLAATAAMAPTGPTRAATPPSAASRPAAALSTGDVLAASAQPISVSTRSAWWVALSLIAAAVLAAGLRRIPAVVAGAAQTCELDLSRPR